jgi:hypothetical protein
VTPRRESGWSGGPKSEAARHLLEHARRVDVAVPELAEQRVWHALRRRGQRRRRGVAGVTFLAGALSALIAFVLFHHRTPPTVAQAVPASSVIPTLRVGETLPQRDDVSVVEVSGVGRLVASAHTVANLSASADGGVLLELSRGSVLAHVFPRRERPPCWVRTPRFTAKVVGTVLRVSVADDGASQIAVGHGQVSVATVDGKQLTLASGQRHPARASDVPTHEELVALGDDAEGVTEASFAVAAPQMTTDAVAAESALYEEGWSAWRRRDGHRALAVWKSERERFPHGLLEAEVQTSIIDVLVVLQRSQDAAVEIEDFLAKHPGSLRGTELRFVLGTLYREIDHDCRRAERQFSRALEAPGSTFAKQARHELKACPQAP